MSQKNDISIPALPSHVDFLDVQRIWPSHAHMIAEDHRSQEELFDAILNELDHPTPFLTKGLNVLDDSYSAFKPKGK